MSFRLWERFKDFRAILTNNWMPKYTKERAKKGNLLNFNYSIAQTLLN